MRKSQRFHIITFIFLLLCTATILGDKDVYIDVGSSLNLMCHVSQVDSRSMYPYEPHYIIWKKDNQTIDYEGDRKDQSKDNRNRYRVVSSTDDLEQPTSRLTIHRVESSDDGKYTCHPSEPSKDASVRVHIVIDGKVKNQKL